jgi:hypothetical protein
VDTWKRLDSLCYACLKREATFRCEYDARQEARRDSTFFHLCDHCHDRLRLMVQGFIGVKEVET